MEAADQPPCLGEAFCACARFAMLLEDAAECLVEGLDESFSLACGLGWEAAKQSEGFLIHAERALERGCLLCLGEEADDTLLFAHAGGDELRVGGEVVFERVEHALGGFFSSGWGCEDEPCEDAELVFRLAGEVMRECLDEALIVLVELVFPCLPPYGFCMLDAFCEFLRVMEGAVDEFMPHG